MNDTKSLFASKTIWGVVVTALPAILKLFGFETLPGFEESAAETINGLTTAFGAVLAVYGRITATKNLVAKK